MNDLAEIKKLYGEKMMQLCRSLFPVVLETPGLLIKTLKENFEPSKFLYEDIIRESQDINFYNYILKKVGFKEDEEDIVLEKSAKELLDEAEYILYECKTEWDIQKFRKYYQPNEQLCTFDGGRLKSCQVFFAVKKNVEEIKRENFKKPEREDEYGTSVISIQFSRGEQNILSIKNRYNHTVENPDCTFGNDLDNIIPGLTNSFKRDYNLNLISNKSGLCFSNYVIAKNGKYYRYNQEINGVYYCPNNIIIDNYEVIRYEKERYIVLDYFIIDLKEKTITTYDKDIKDSFSDTIGKISKINITKNGDNKILEIISEENKVSVLEINKYNQLINFKNNSIEKINDEFLSNNKFLKHIELEKVTEIGNNFLYNNLLLTAIYFPELLSIGDNFLYFAGRFNRNNAFSEILAMDKVVLPKVKNIGNNFMFHCEGLYYLDISSVETIKDNFMDTCKKIKVHNMKSLKTVADFFLGNVENFTNIEFLELTSVGNYFLYSMCQIENVNLPKLETVGKNFLFFANRIDNINMPSIKKINPGFMLNLGMKKGKHILNALSNKIKDLKESIFNVPIKSIKKCDEIHNLNPKEKSQKNNFML